MVTACFTAVVLIAYLSPVFTQCPFGSSNPTTKLGTTNPSTPSVRVSKTCYTVNFQGTQVFDCRDSKMASALKSARWLKAPSYTQIVPSTGSFINGDIATPNLTVSNAKSSYAGDYICQLCYESNYRQCTNSSAITLIVIGTGLTSVTAVPSSTTPLRGSQVTFTCSEEPSGAATSYRWFFGTNQVGSLATYTISSIGTSQTGAYKCEAGNIYNTLNSTTVIVDVQYVPEARGGSTVTITGDLSTADIVITCNMNANPAVLFYTFYNAVGSLLQNSSSNTFTVTSSNGYQIYSCKGLSNVGLSSRQYHNVQVDSTTPDVGAATENTGIGTGTIAAIILGIIFLLLLIIIIVVCCFSYGWCRKKEKVEPEIIVAEKPVAKPYVSSVSASSVEPRYITPHYHLKPARSSGPIISMFDDEKQPRAHQLPALDTQYLYKDNVPRKHKKKRRRHHHRHHDDESPPRQYYEHEPDVGYAVIQPASDEDLVVVPGRENYFE